jgi:hypothetical protein
MTIKRCHICGQWPWDCRCLDCKYYDEIKDACIIELWMRGLRGGRRWILMSH